MTGLVERLQKILDELDREAAWEAEVNGGRPDLWPDVDVPIALVREAAARIAALEAELAEAKAERDGLQKSHDMLFGAVTSANAGRTAAEARAEKMAEKVNAAREFVKRHPSLTLIDLAEFEAFLLVPAALAALGRPE